MRNKNSPAQTFLIPQDLQMGGGEAWVPTGGISRVAEVVIYLVTPERQFA